jgi:hypothetical protein
MEAEWTPFQTYYFSGNQVARGIEPGAPGSVASELWPLDHKVINIIRGSDKNEYSGYEFLHSWNRAVVQEVSRRLPTEGVQIRFQVGSCGIYGRQNDTGLSFLRVLIFPCKFLFHQLIH